MNCHRLWHFHTSCISGLIQCISNCKNLHRSCPLSQSSWHIHSHMNAFTQICITCNPNWILTVYVILNKLSPVVTNSHLHFKNSTMLQSMQKLIHIMILYRSSWHIHSHMNAFTQIYITCNPNWIVTVYDIYLEFVTSCDVFNHHSLQDLCNESVDAKTHSDHAPISTQLAHSFTLDHIHSNMLYMHSQLNCHSRLRFEEIVTSCDIFKHHAFRDLYNASVIFKLTQIMLLSQSSWDIHSHMNAFTRICVKCNPNWIVTVSDIY